MPLVRALIPTADMRDERPAEETILNEVKQSTPNSDNGKSTASDEKNGSEGEDAMSAGINSQWSDDGQHTEKNEENSVNTSGNYTIIDEMFSDRPYLLARFK